MAENHDIILDNNTFQKVSNDDNTGQIIMAIRFFWDTNGTDVLKGHFRLRNRQTLNDNYNIIKAHFCSQYQRIEVHIASHEQYNNQEVYTLTDVPLTGLRFEDGTQREFIFRVTQNQTGSAHGDCENVNLNPDDKDGSILIGTQ